MSKIRIPRRIKKWRKKLFNGYPTLPERIPFKPSWLFMIQPERKANRLSRVMRRYIRVYRTKKLF